LYQKVIEYDITFGTADRLSRLDGFQRSTAAIAANLACFVIWFSGFSMELGLQDGAVGAHLGAVDGAF